VASTIWRLRCGGLRLAKATKAQSLHAASRYRLAKSGARAAQLASFHIDPQALKLINAVPKEMAREISAEMVPHARALVPRKTGELAESIQSSETPKKMIVFADAEYDPRESYAAHVEFGTQFQPPRPYMRPALLAAARKVVPVLRKHYDRLARGGSISARHVIRMKGRKW